MTTQRYTTKDAQESLEALAKALGKTAVPLGKYDSTPGVWSIDNAPQYGGVCIVERDGHGESRPYGNYSRMAIKDFCACVDFALQTLAIRFPFEK